MKYGAKRSNYRLPGTLGFSRKKVQEERIHASPELRWHQLNAAYIMGQSLGLVRDNPSELLVFNLWAKLKNQIQNT